MEEMPESDLPKSIMNVPEVFHYIVNHHIEKGRKGRGEVEDEGIGRGGEEEGVHIHCIVTLSLCLCSDVKKN